MWAGLRGTFRVAKSLEVREALRAGLGVRFQFLFRSLGVTFLILSFESWGELSLVPSFDLAGVRPRDVPDQGQSGSKFHFVEVAV